MRLKQERPEVIWNLLNASEHIYFDVQMPSSYNCASWAERHGEKTIRRFSKEWWLDMGMATVVFTVHTDHQGCLVADV